MTPLGKSALITLFCLLFVFGCNEVTVKDSLTRLDDTLLRAGNFLRWNSFQDLQLMQTDEAQQHPVDFRFLRNIRVSSLQRTGKRLAPDSQSATIFYAVEFYDTDSNTTKFMDYQQTWVLEEDNKRQWKLTSDLPDFKAVIVAQKKAREAAKKPKIKVIERF